MNYVIIVAGGMGVRMGSDTPKQFLLLSGLPVMMHTINAFYRSSSSPHIVVVIPSSLHNHWSALCEAHHFGVPHTIAYGGQSRFESVKSGLDTIKSMSADLKQSLIAVHDAARPLISPELIDGTYNQAALTGAAALAIKSTDSIRLRSKNGLKNNAYPRELVYLMQTPQTFNGAILSEAYEQPDDKTYTDDASVVEKKGYPIVLIDGDTLNIKITFPGDLRIAEMLLGDHTFRRRFG
ncbi:2-C-methyl-D-erythritol 4-phosphate cytidylyltransferase [Parapedobacter pyrenivorans]|uniref:2-C-methyl-D-erythritol 4-phosphate cytidylyltransferase n=1 Tax=Parapedobacter pyrenivorans TaxID=1305674 RepID=A0A917HTP1_9SPHI|nr:2-C-methyl-D-erythritol 4-phosphate cytidylyltransferase [Parapedobacter pyrenivorans]GGG88798.1 2-C-methyl-D-erythritol 4-phosphate cytidylyltransferase [Parapedobacter pyrenivorans]